MTAQSNLIADYAELLPCPFCGGPPRSMTPIFIKGGTYKSVFCDADDCVNPETGGLPDDQAIVRWNTRADHKRMSAEIAVLREALKLAEFGFNHVRCSVCGGFDGEQENNFQHNKTCPVGAALASSSADGSPVENHKR